MQNQPKEWNIDKTVKEYVDLLKRKKRGAKSL
jgi:hypothetical protein